MGGARVSAPFLFLVSLKERGRDVRDTGGVGKRECIDE